MAEVEHLVWVGKTKGQSKLALLLQTSFNTLDTLFLNLMTTTVAGGRISFSGGSGPTGLLS
ncbi:MAG: hypothetical protein K0U98_25710 [Deltaproteobacteria bacterium]|nr:hypothetical protein [Deltaproteobacteria bacterium]